MKQRSSSPYSPAAIAAVLLLLTLAIAASTRGIKQSKITMVRDKLTSGAASPQLRNPKSAEDAATTDSQLAKLIDQAIDTSEFAPARWGLIVISLRDGHALYSRNADRLFTPASNMKLYTTAVALDLLGSDYRWRTSVYSSVQPDANGAINGDLTLYGRGAPDLSSTPRKDEASSLVQLADELYQRGVRRVSGNVIGDESYFRADPLGSGWAWNDVQWYFGAEPSALSINGNEMDINALPGSKASEPAVVKLSEVRSYAHLSNSMITSERGGQLNVGIYRGLSDNEVRVWGELPQDNRGFDARLSVHYPALWAARLFVDELRARGIVANGEIRTRDFRVPEEHRFNPASGVELAYVLSKPLSDIVRATNKESVNLDAELILRTLGRERGEMAPDADSHKQHERSDDEAGIAVMRVWLSRAGIAAGDFALHDGCGLSRLDLVTPEATTRLLAAVSRTASGLVFRDSLPISGTDGTLKSRLRNYTGRVAAKTGTLLYDNSLSGYVTTSDSQLLAFSIMCNDYTGTKSSTGLIDEVVAMLADYPHLQTENR